MVMAMMGFDHRTATFAYPGVTLGAMGAGAYPGDALRSRGSRDAPGGRAGRVYRSAANLGFDQLIDPRETRDVLLDAVARALSPPGPGRAGQPDSDHALSHSCPPG